MQGRSLQEREIRLLRCAFLLGAITDALALVPMLVPTMAALLWGLGDATGSYRFGIGYAASLMLGWRGFCCGRIGAPSSAASWPR